MLCTALPGVIGVHWSYCTSWLHRHVGYRYLLMGMLAIGLVSCVLGLSPQLIFGRYPVSIVINSVRALSLGIIFVLDYAQTIVLSTLITLLIPSYTENESSAQLWSSSLFLALQLGVYFSTLLIGVFALPGFFNLLGVSALAVDLITPPLIALFFAALREMLISSLWNSIQTQLSTNPLELDALTRAAL